MNNNNNIRPFENNGVNCVQAWLDYFQALVLNPQWPRTSTIVKFGVGGLATASLVEYLYYKSQSEEVSTYRMVHDGKWGTWSPDDDEPPTKCLIEWFIAGGFYLVKKFCFAAEGAFVGFCMAVASYAVWSFVDFCKRSYDQGFIALGRNPARAQDVVAVLGYPAQAQD